MTGASKGPATEGRSNQTPPRQPRRSARCMHSTILPAVGESQTPSLLPGQSAGGRPIWALSNSARSVSMRTMVGSTVCAGSVRQHQDRVSYPA